MLVPARPGSRWFEALTAHADEVRFLPGRVTFEGAPGGSCWTRASNRPRYMPTLEEFARDLFADPLAPRRQATTDRCERSYNALIHEPLGAYLLDDLTPVLGRTWADDVVSEHGTRDRAMFAHKTVKLLLDEAMDAILLGRNVAVGIKFSRRAQAAMRRGGPSAHDFTKKKPALN